MFRTKAAVDSCDIVRSLARNTSDSFQVWLWIFFCHVWKPFTVVTFLPPTFPLQGPLPYSLPISLFARQSELFSFLSLPNWKTLPDLILFFPFPNPPYLLEIICFQSGSLALIPGNFLTCFIICAPLWLPYLSTMKYMPRFHLVHCIFIGHLLYAKAFINHCGGKKR